MQILSEVKSAKSKGLITLMNVVQKIACTNNAPFEMNFEVDTPNGFKTPETSNYPMGQTKVIDLDKFGIAEGTKIQPVVHAEGGETVSGDPPVCYAKNGQTATYKVNGKACNYSVKLTP